MSGHDSLLYDIGQALLQQQKPLAVFKLAAYAADAMRVLWVFEQHADMSSAFNNTMQAVCADWRNPGAVQQPADLIATALNYALADLRQAMAEMDTIIIAARTP